MIYLSNNSINTKMNTLILPGKILTPCSAGYLDKLKKKSNLSGANLDTDALILSGSVPAVLSAVRILAKDDVIDVDFVSMRSKGNVEFTVRTIKKVMRDVKDARFGDVLRSHDFPPCLGNTPWRFITPKTHKAHDQEVITKISDCLSCEHFPFCSQLTIIRKLEERKWVEG